MSETLTRVPAMMGEPLQTLSSLTIVGATLSASLAMPALMVAWLLQMSRLSTWRNA